MAQNKLNLKELKQYMLKKDPDRLYFFYGPDEHTKSYYENMLKTNICGDSMGFVKLGEKFSLEVLSDEICAIPMFGGDKFILVKNSGLFKTATGKTKSEPVEKFANIIENIPQGVTVCFSETEFDTKNEYFNELIDNSTSYEASIQEDEVLIKFVIAVAQRNGIEFDKDAAHLLIEGGEKDTLTLLNETEKLCLASQNGKIEKNLVRECCSLSLHANVFNLTDSICNADKSDAMAVVNDLLSSGEEIQKLLIMVGSHFVKLYYVKAFSLSGKNSMEIANIMGLKPWYVGKLLNQCKNISIEKLKSNVDFCFKADCSIKSGQMTAKDAFYLLIMQS